MTSHACPPNFPNKVVKNLNVSYREVNPNDSTEDIIDKKKGMKGRKATAKKGNSAGAMSCELLC